MTTNVRRLIERLFNRQDLRRASEASQGWQAIDDSIKLSGWSPERRVVVLRRRIKNDGAHTAKKGRKGDNEAGQMVLALPHAKVLDNAQLWESPALLSRARAPAPCRRWGNFPGACLPYPRMHRAGVRCTTRR